MEALNFDLPTTQETPQTTEALFNVWFATNEKKAFKYAATLEKSPDLAQDLAMDAFEKLLKPDSNGLARFLSDVDGKLVYTTIKRLYIDQWRKRQRNATLSAVQIDADIEGFRNLSETLADEANTFSDTEKALEKAENVLATLDGNEFACLHAHAVEGLKYREIVEKFGLPMGTVKTHISRARKKLVR